ncbi:MAG: hypothetical protein P8Y96_10410 [Desulfuromonadales bacterium]|jgi:hypothetical protein
MPIHLNDLDVAKETEGLRSALIIPCYMCPAVTVATREKKPFIQFMSNFLKSPPFEKYIKGLQSVLSDKGIETKVFESRFIHHWFLCMWPSGRRRKLMGLLDNYDAAIVLGCDSATETVRELVEVNGCKVIQGMEVDGFMNAKMTFSLPCNISFEDCRIVPFSRQKTEY